MRATTCVVLVPLALAACSHPSSDTYDAGAVGRTIETAKASVVTSRVVEVTGETNLVGPAAGGVAAAATTGALVRGKGSGALQVLAGLIGAGAGYAIQKTANDREGIEYVLKMDDGRTVTLVQNREDEEEPLPNGSPVLVQLNGSYTRIIADPTTEETPPTQAWVDPDKREVEAKAGGDPEERGPLDLSVIGQPENEAGQQVDQQ